jgi:cation diffusion facilitator CzcD-associated flavoprotein CzcO
MDDLYQSVVIPTGTYSGQSGLALAARLKALNVPTLIVDKSPQIGSSWRQRYEVRTFYPLLFLTLRL